MLHVRECQVCVASRPAATAGTRAADAGLFLESGQAPHTWYGLPPTDHKENYTTRRQAGGPLSQNRLRFKVPELWGKDDDSPLEIGRRRLRGGSDCSKPQLAA